MPEGARSLWALLCDGCAQDPAQDPGQSQAALGCDVVVFRQPRLSRSILCQEERPASVLRWGREPLAFPPGGGVGPVLPSLSVSKFRYCRVTLLLSLLLDAGRTAGPPPHCPPHLTCVCCSLSYLLSLHCSSWSLCYYFSFRARLPHHLPALGEAPAFQSLSRPRGPLRWGAWVCPLLLQELMTCAQ